MADTGASGRRGPGASSSEGTRQPGLERHRLRHALDIRLPVLVFDGAIAAMVGDGALQCEGPWLKLPGHAVRLTATDERLWTRIKQILERALFQPPRVRDVARMLGSREEEVRPDGYDRPRGRPAAGQGGPIGDIQARE